MPERCQEPMRCCPENGRNAMSIHTRKITDSCRDKDCIEDLRVYLTKGSQSLFESAARECKRLGAVPLPSTERMQAEMDALTARRAALTAERQKARREEQDYAAVRRNVEEFLSPPRQAPARQKDMEL